MRLETVVRATELAVEIVIAASATAYLVNGRGEVLVLWEVVCLGYLLVGAVRAWRTAGRDARADAPRRVPDMAGYPGAYAGAWLLPLLASAVGFACAFAALQARASAATDDSAMVLALLASSGVVISWLLLHVGFADIYEIVCLHHPTALSFPDTEEPGRIDYLYFSVTVGTSFAISDVTARSPLVRRVVVVHGILSFFYNALVIAVAIQVLQQVLGS